MTICMGHAFDTPVLDVHGDTDNCPYCTITWLLNKLAAYKKLEEACREWKPVYESLGNEPPDDPITWALNDLDGKPQSRPEDEFKAVPCSKCGRPHAMPLDFAGAVLCEDCDGFMN